MLNRRKRLRNRLRFRLQESFMLQNIKSHLTERWVSCLHIKKQLLQTLILSGFPPGAYLIKADIHTAFIGLLRTNTQVMLTFLSPKSLFRVNLSYHPPPPEKGPLTFKQVKDEVASDDN